MVVTPPRRRAEEEKGGEAAIADKDEVAPRQPVADLQGKLPPNVEQRLVLTTLLVTGPLGGDKGGEERQRPNPLSPRDGCDQHQAHPAQPARLHEVGLRRAHRIAVDAARPDAPAPAALDGVVEGHDHRPARRKGVNEKPEQEAGTRSRAPYGAAEHTVVVDEVALVRATCAPQKAGHGAPPGNQDRANQQHTGVPPGAVDEQGREGQDDRGEAGGQVGHGASLGGDAPNLPVTPASSPAPAQLLT
jgi:hypothetical protein